MKDLFFIPFSRLRRSSHKKLLSFTIFFLLSSILFGQAVTEIITDYDGYWQSSATAINPVKPDNSHNLLAFTFNGTRYATGVNNTLLTANGLSFMSSDFRALGVSAINGVVNANTKVGLGSMYDGVENGPSLPAPSRELASYITDGIQGLDIGTGVANLPVGQLVFSVTNLQPGLIGDGIPDVLVTQIADPSGTADSYRFTDASGNLIGNAVNISFSTVSAVGNWTVDFYEASQNPMTLAAGFTKTARPIRLWAADFSTFGIDAGNYNLISKFEINLRGNSDVAFVAYNHTAITLLPLNLAFFKADVVNKNIYLSWQTVSEKDLDYFELEGSSDGINFYPLGTVPAGNSASGQSYSFLHTGDAARSAFYRLKQVSHGGSFTYSKVIRLNKITNHAPLQFFPNPVLDKLTVLHEMPNNGMIEVWNMSGVKLTEKKIRQGSFRTEIDMHHWSPGAYQLVLINHATRSTALFIKQ